jgi:starch synthase
MAQFLAAQSHVLYTEPQPLQAGREAAVYYNPQATVLAGRQEVWMRGGFNRWSHRGGTWGPIKMEPTKDGSHLKATGQRTSRSLDTANMLVLLI